MQVGRQLSIRLAQQWSQPYIYHIMMYTFRHHYQKRLIKHVTNSLLSLARDSEGIMQFLWLYTSIAVFKNNQIPTHISTQTCGWHDESIFNDFKRLQVPNRDSNQKVLPHPISSFSNS